MSPEVLDTLVSNYMQTKQPVYSFAWQGGEPSIMGLDFFKEAVRLQRLYAPEGAAIGNGFQTNAILIDDAFAEFFAQYNFLLGVSLDGPEHIHNRYRMDHAAKGTFKRVMNGIDALKRAGVDFNILVLVSKSNVRKAKEVYNFLVDNGFYHHQYIPCVEYKDPDTPLPFAITGEEWGEFLCGIFDQWYPDDIRKVSVRYFDSIIYQQVERTPNICHMGRNCCQYLVVEYDGRIYPCDFFVTPELEIGNIADTNFEQALSKQVYQSFGKQKTKWNNSCKACKYLQVCSGDCLKHRMLTPEAPPHTLSVLCKGWKMFFDHTYDTFREIGSMVKKERRMARQNEK